MAMNVVQSQRLSVLLHALQQHSLNARQTPLQLLQALHCIVPNVAVENWLKQQLTLQQGISAHWQFHYGIRSFQWNAYQQVLPEKDRVRKANLPQLMMKWRIYQLLQQFFQQDGLHIASDHVLASVLQRVDDSAQALAATQRSAKIHSMLYWLATQTAQVLSHYSIYRGQCQMNCSPPCRCKQNWLAQWGAGHRLPLTQMLRSHASLGAASSEKATPEQASPELQQAQQIEAWQGFIWRELFHQDWLESQKIDQQFWQQLETAASQAQALSALPSQLMLFTLSELAPSQLQFLRRLAQHIDILILHFNPSQEYWADTVDPNWKKQYDLGVKTRYLSQHPNASDAELARFFQQFTLHFNAELRESRHPLLTRFGKQARDQFSMLANLAAGDEGQWVDAFVDDFPDTILGRVQRDILYLNDVQENSHRLAPDDSSIQVHVCHSALRQLEVLKDQVLSWLNQDPSRQPCDIVVLCPQLQSVTALIRGVFDSDPQQAGYVPIKIAGIAPQDHAQAWQAIYGRMQLLQGRFQPQHLADWLSLPAIMQRYTLDATRIERLMTLLCAAGFKRGFDAAHLQQTLDPTDHDYRFSLQFALNRLALGVVMPEHGLFAEQLSFEGVIPSDFELIATLMQIFEHLHTRRDWLNHNAAKQQLSEQIQLVLNEIDEFITAGVSHLQTAREQAQKLWRMYGLATVNQQSELAALQALALPLAAVLDEISQNVQAQFEQATPTGAMTFAELGQLRPLPYKLMILLNLDNGTFPSRQRPSAFDLMQLLRPQLGDRSRLEDDQGAFLDAILLAEQQLWLFYNGFDVADSEVREPSSVLQELLDHLAILIEHEGEVSLAAQCEIDGLKVPQHLASLYQVHPLQPFDASGFLATHQRYPDVWAAVAQQLQQATGQRLNPLNINSVEAVESSDLDGPQLLDARQWIADMLFPARVFLKQYGIQSIHSSDSFADQEVILLDGLGRHQLRDWLLQQHLAASQQHLTAPQLATPTHDLSSAAAETRVRMPLSDAPLLALLQDQLPVGKMQFSALQRAEQEYQALLQRMQPFAAVPTATTQQTLCLNEQYWFSIHVPVTITNSNIAATNDATVDVAVDATVDVNGQAAASNHSAGLSTDWVSIQAVAARGRRKVQVWLEYVLWCLWVHAQDSSIAIENLRRVAVMNDATLIYQGLTAQAAQQHFQAWWSAWHYAQQQVLVLPAELLMQLAKSNELPEWEVIEDNRHHATEHEMHPNTQQNTQRNIHPNTQRNIHKSSIHNNSIRPKNLDALLAIWRNSYNASGLDLREQEQSRYHRDWRFLLQFQADDALLAQACNTFAHALYQPIFEHLEVQ